MSEPVRPPPPKSYVPISLLDEPVVPSLPPRPQGEEAGNTLPPRPQPRTAPPSAVSNDDTGVLRSTTSNGDLPTATPTDVPPMKPERKNRKGPPKPPTPYATTTKKMTPGNISEEELRKVSFDFTDTPTDNADSAEPSMSSRRHTIAARPKKKEEDSPPNKGPEFSRPKLSPPDMMLDSLYSTVDKDRRSKRYPAPSMPAPPPPYEGKAMKDSLPKNMPSPTPPPAVDTDAGKPERSISPPGYEPVSSVSTVGPTKGGPRLPPSRPSRPPAANPPPAKGPRARSATYSSSSLAAARSKVKKGNRPEITVMDARPMDSDVVPSPYLQPVDPPKPKPPATRPSPPQPKRPENGPPKINPPSKRPSPPQPKKSDASPKPPSPPTTRPSPPQPKKSDKPPSPPTKRPSPPQPKKPTPETNPPTTRPSPPQPRKQISAEQPDPQGTPPPKPERSAGRKAPPRPGQSPPQRHRPPPPKAGTKASPPAPRKDMSSAGDGKNKRPPPLSLPPAASLPATSRAGSAPPTEDDPSILEQLSVLGPPPDEEPPDLPMEVTNEAAGLLDSEEEEQAEPLTSDTPPEDKVQSADPPSKPPHPTRPPPVKRNKTPRPSGSPATTATKQQESPKLPAPASRPPPPKPSRRPSHDQKDSAHDTPTLPAVGKMVSPSEEEAVDEGRTKQEAEDKMDSPKPQKPGSSPAPKRPPPMKRPPAPRVTKKNTEQTAKEEATTPCQPTPIPRSSLSDLDASLPNTTDTPTTEGAGVPAPRPVVSNRPPSLKRPPRRASRKLGGGAGESAEKEIETSTDKGIDEGEAGRPKPKARTSISQEPLSPEEQDKGQPSLPPPRKPSVKRPPPPTSTKAEETEPSESKAIEPEVGKDQDSGPKPSTSPVTSHQPSEGKGRAAPPPKQPPLKRPPPPTSRKSMTEVKAVRPTEREASEVTQEPATINEEVNTGQDQEEGKTNVPKPRARTSTHETPSPVEDKDQPPPPKQEEAAPSPGPSPSPSPSPGPTSSTQPSQATPAPGIAKKKPSVKKPPLPKTAKPKSHTPSPAVSPNPPISPKPSISPNPHPSPELPPLSPNPPVASKDTPLPPPTASKRTSVTKPAPPPTVPKSRTPTTPHPLEVDGSETSEPTRNEEQAPNLPEESGVQDREKEGTAIVLSKPPPRKATHPQPKARPAPPPQPKGRAHKPTPPPGHPEVKVSPEDDIPQSQGEATPVEGVRKLSQRGKTSPRSSTSKLKGDREEKGEHVEEGVHVLRYSDNKSGGSSREPSPVPARKVEKSSPKPPRPASMPPPRASPGQGTKNEHRPTDSPGPGRPAPPPTTSKPAPVKPPTPSNRPAPPAPASKPTGPPKPPAPSTSNKPSRPSGPPSRPGAPPTKPPALPTKTPTTSQTRPAPRKTSNPAPKHPAGRTSNNPPPLPPRPTPGHLLYRYVCAEPHGLATAHHDATDEDEISYQEGDVIELIEKVDEHWYYAANADLDMCEGLVLASNLNIVKRLAGQDKVEGFEDGPCAVAMHDFQGETTEELSFNAGDLIMLKSHYGEDWFRGKLINGNQGIFPKNFVEVVEELPADAYEAPPPAPTAAQDTTQIRGPYGVALYSFSAQGPGELSISEGDQVELIERVDDSWLKGRLGGKEGIFPADFVKVTGEVPAKGSGSQVAKPLALKGQMCTALYDFDGQPGELSFKVGDQITLVSRVDPEWVNGELRGQKGMFPAEFVDSVPADLPLVAKEETDTDTSSKPEGGGTGKCKALYDFEGEGDGELSFGPGEMIDTLKEVDADWMRGRIGNREGIFPKAFVEVISEIPPTEISTSSKPRMINKAKPASSITSPKTSAQFLTDDLMPKALATADYNARSSSEISFRKGEVLYLLSKESEKVFMGERLETGDLGTFPASYVDIVTPLP